MGGGGWGVDRRCIMVYAKMVNSFPIELVRRSCKISIRCDHVLNYPADHSVLSKIDSIGILFLCLCVCCIAF